MNAFPGLRWLSRQRDRVAATRAIDGAFMPALVAIEERPPIPAARVSLWVCALFLVGIVAWASVARLDVVVAATGVVVYASGVTELRAPDDGVISLRAHHGDQVRQGDLVFEIERDGDSRGVTAAASGYIDGLGYTDRTSVRVGHLLGHVVSDDATLAVRSWVSQDEYSVLHPGMGTLVIVDAGNNGEPLRLEGRITHIDRKVSQDANGYTGVAIDVTVPGLNRRTILPGMSVSVSIRTGDRSIVRYFIDPVWKRTGEAMRER